MFDILVRRLKIECFGKTTVYLIGTNQKEKLLNKPKNVIHIPIDNE